MIFTVSGIIAFYLWLTEEEGALRKPFAWCAARVSNKYLRKALFDCLHCRAFWLTVVAMVICSGCEFNYLFSIPLVWILSITGYRLIN